MSDRVQELADHLRGTCKSLDEGCQELFDHDAAFLSVSECLHLDDLVFECQQCGWWCEIGEMSTAEDQVCDECAPSEDD